MSTTFFISHPSGGRKHTPTFFNAIDYFAEANAKAEFVFPHEAEEEVQLTKDNINKADYVLVEVSIPSTGSGIELGWANAADKKVIAFHQGGSQPSPAVKFVATDINVYVTEDDIIKKLESLL